MSNAPGAVVPDKIAMEAAPTDRADVLWVTATNIAEILADTHSIPVGTAVYVEMMSSVGPVPHFFYVRPGGNIRIDGICVLDPANPDTASGNVMDAHGNYQWTVIPDPAAEGTSQVPDPTTTKLVLLHFDRYAPAGYRLSLAWLYFAICTIEKTAGGYPQGGTVRLSLTATDVLDNFDVADTDAVTPPKNTFNGQPTYGSVHLVEFEGGGKVNAVNDTLPIRSGNYFPTWDGTDPNWAALTVAISGHGVLVEISGWSVLTGTMLVKKGFSCDLLVSGGLSRAYLG